MAGLRDSMVGRAVLVATVLALGWAAWNLTLRPYPSDHCSSPASVLTAQAESEEETNLRRDPPRDSNGDGFISRSERDTHERREELIEELYGPDLSSAEIRRRACRDALTEAGFWFRGLAPLAVVVGGALAVRYIATGSVREGSPQDPEREDVVP